MMQQAVDFREECDALLTLLETLEPADFDRPTLFKQWTVNDVLVHLHFWNRAADQSLRDSDGFQELFAKLQSFLAQGNLRAFENGEVAERGPELVAVWRDFYRDMAERWVSLDPKIRVKWAGPEMSVRSSITARQMETWAHAQEIFDLFGKVREEADRIRNIVILGVNTFQWGFKVRGMTPPENMPHLTLEAPSGAVWHFGEEDPSNRIEGSAVEFCQVVTQTRNFADTSLKTTGEAARLWMENAQCFAGPPEKPPAPGVRVNPAI